MPGPAHGAVSRGWMKTHGAFRDALWVPFPRLRRAGDHTEKCTGVVPGRAKRGEGDPGLSETDRELGFPRSASTNQFSLATGRERKRSWIASLRSQ